MGKCTIIGKISAPVNVGQAIRINGLKCTEITTWTVDDVYGGESVTTDFYIENRSNVTCSVTFTVSTATDGEYTAGVYETDGVTPVTAPVSVGSKDTDNYKFKIEFDQNIEDDTFTIELIFEYD